MDVTGLQISSDNQDYKHQMAIRHKYLTPVKWQYSIFTALSGAFDIQIVPAAEYDACPPENTTIISMFLIEVG